MGVIADLRVSADDLNHRVTELFIRVGELEETVEKLQRPWWVKLWDWLAGR